MRCHSASVRSVRYRLGVTLGRDGLLVREGILGAQPPAMGSTVATDGSGSVR